VSRQGRDPRSRAAVRRHRHAWLLPQPTPRRPPRKTTSECSSFGKIGRRRLRVLVFGFAPTRRHCAIPPSHPASEGNAEPCQLIEYFEVPELRAAHILPASSLRRACRLRRAQSNEKTAYDIALLTSVVATEVKKAARGIGVRWGRGMTNQPATSPTQTATFHTASTATAPATVAGIICCLHCTAVSSPRRCGSLVRRIAAECHKLLRADTSTGIVEGM
jgi:hypothetical protein